MSTKFSRKNSLIYLPGGEIFRRVSNSIRGAGVIDAVAQAAFNEKKWVWVEDKNDGYVAGYITKEIGNQVEVHFNDYSSRIVDVDETEKMNPPKFDKVEDMADLTYLNEASIIHNLRQRYFSDYFYTYSGLFLVAVNPYHDFPIYTDEIIQSYKGKRRHEMPPHIYAIADSAYHNMLQEQSGAGKTVNTKKVIQYIAAIASDSSKKLGKLEQQILQANPILEAFGNAQTIRNNNSSRFVKKSRVTHQTPEERNFHIFYQLLKGAPQEFKSKLLLFKDEDFLLDDTLDDYRFTKFSRQDIDGVDDSIEFNNLMDAMNIIGMTIEEQMNLFRVIAAILHLGNIKVTSNRDDQAQIPETSVSEKVCHLLGIHVSDFIKGLVKPQVKAGREWVAQSRTKEQVLYSIDALAKSLYERNFGALVERINKATDRPTNKSNFIGVLDIAEEYRRESIEWKFIDFGLDLQPTIDLIEKVNPVGILSCLDEECVMPKATDKTFVEKLHSLWKDKSSIYQVPRFQQGFILQHYAAKVEYRTEGWLNKNKDPLNENITKLLAYSNCEYIASLFQDFYGDNNNIIDYGTKNRVKRGAFRTVGHRHKEQLHSLMKQLYSTHPHFVRCIVPNEEKKPGKIYVPLVLDQLRCNGVLEGIRICRTGFPNRLGFVEFRQRYEILVPGIIPDGFIDGREAARQLLEAFNLDSSQYRIGLSKVLFKSGVLAELEEIRDGKLAHVFTRFQAYCRGHLARKQYEILSKKVQAARIIQKNVRVYNQLRKNSWWNLYSKVKPTLNTTRWEEQIKLRDNRIRELEERLKFETQERERLEALTVQLESEKTVLEETLDDERVLAQGNEEILAQTRQRERDLEEEVDELTEEVEKLEGECEQLARSKETLENQMQELGLLDAPDQLLVLKEAEETQKEVIRLERANKALQVELDELKEKLEDERTEKQKGSMNRRKLMSQLQEYQMKLETDTQKYSGWEDSVASYREKITSLASNLESSELARIKAEKSEGLLKLHINELEESMVEICISNFMKIQELLKFSISSGKSE
ncbi:7439_t:CDS:10 [Entrophospora sp. SA101]|nr:7439_t:CDS:10 [Entrophospora sp. SA101]CAJ0830749.1 7857_t:CDS:10 [Entrophospora sp. SA101]